MFGNKFPKVVAQGDGGGSNSGSGYRSPIGNYLNPGR